MGSVTRVLVVSSLLLAPALLLSLGAADAGSPRAQPWASVTTPGPGGPVLALAGSDTLDTFAVGTGDQIVTAGGQSPSAVGVDRDDDFFAYNFTKGRNHTFSENPAPTGTNGGEVLARMQNEGTPVVAASANGRYIAGGAAFTATDNLYVMDALQNNTRTKALPEPVRGLAMSTDGSLVAVATGSGSAGHVYLFRSSNLEQLLSYSTNGPMNTVAMSGDGRWIVAGGREVVGSTVYGGLHLFEHKSGAGTTQRVWNATLAIVDAGVVESIRMSRAGDVFLASTQGGNVYSYRNLGSLTDAAPRSTLALGPGNVLALALSADGRAVAAANTSGITYAAVTAEGDIAPRWTYASAAATRTLQLSATGEYLAVANGRALAFHSGNSTPIWQLPGLDDVRSVILSADGARVAVANGDKILAYDANRVLSLFIGATPEAQDLTANYTAKAGESVTVPLRVSNDGSVTQTIALSVNASPGLEPTVDTPSITLPPGQSATANVTLTPSTVGTGNLEAIVTASAPGAGSRNVTIGVGLAPIRGFGMTLAGESNRIVRQGQEDEIVAFFNSSGNVPTTITVRVEQDGGRWNATWDNVDGSGRLSLPAAATTTARLTVSVPGDAPDGARVSLTIVATSGSLEYKRTISYQVNPNTAFTASIDGNSRIVSPGRAATYNLTLKNTGSVDALVLVRPTIDAGPEDLTGWNVNVEETNVHLARGESRTLQVRVTVPARAEVGDTFRAVLNMSLADKPLEWRNETVLVTVQAPKPKPATTQEENEVPVTGFPVILGLLALAAVAARRQEVRRR